MAKIRVKLDLSLDQAISISAAMMDDARDCVGRARYWDECQKPEHAEVYRALADRSRMIKEAIDLQLKDAKNIYIGGDDEEDNR